MDPEGELVWYKATRGGEPVQLVCRSEVLSYRLHWLGRGRGVRCDRPGYCAICMAGRDSRVRYVFEVESPVTGAVGLVEVGGPQYAELAQIIAEGGMAGVLIEVTLGKGRRERIHVREVRRGVRGEGRVWSATEIASRIDASLKGVSSRKRPPGEG